MAAEIAGIYVLSDASVASFLSIRSIAGMTAATLGPEREKNNVAS
jgi:hypothetical protein